MNDDFEVYSEEIELNASSSAGCQCGGSECGGSGGGGGCQCGGTKCGGGGS